jgi:hypothetical protein
MKLVNESIDDILKPKTRDEILKIPAKEKWKARHKGIFSSRDLASAAIDLLNMLQIEGRRIISYKLGNGFGPGYSGSGLGFVNPKLLEGMGLVIPFYVDDNRDLEKFWEKNHANWDEEVVILKDKQNRIYLAELLTGKMILIEFNTSTFTRVDDDSD